MSEELREALTGGCHRGGCHCGAVRFVVRFDERRALDCNCSVCTKKGFLHLIVGADALDVVAGSDHLREYRFGTETARHFFCATCGVHPFYVPRSHPDGFDVNVRCLDEVAAEGLGAWTIEPFDGRRWEDVVETIR